MSARAALARLRGGWPVIAVLVVLGAVAGAGVAAREPAQHATRVSIVLAPLPVSLAADRAGDDSARPEVVTIDTEAALVVSRESLSRVTGSSSPAVLSELRDRVRVSAVPRTRVLTVEVRAGDAERTEDEAVGVADSYLMTRQGYLSDRRDQALSRVREQLRELGAPGATAEAEITRQGLERASSDIVLTPTSAGEVIGTRGPFTLRRQVEIPVVSGAALGLAAGALLLVMFPGWRPGWRRRR